MFLPALLKPRAARLRAMLWALSHGVPVPELPGPGQVSVPPDPDWPDGFASAMGWVAAGPVLLRLDVAERVAAELAWASSRGRRASAAVPMPLDLASRLSVKAEALPAVLRGLGVRMLPAETLDPAQFGPPAPPMVAALRPHRSPPVADLPPRPAPRRDSPFAALAALRL